MLNPEDIIQALNKAAEINFNCPYRQGNIIRLPASGRVIMTGDLHGNEKNFDKIVNFAALDASKENHLVLHELIHDPSEANPHECHSYSLIYKAAQLLIKYPGQVHYILGNHAMAQITSEEVLKAGKPMVKSLNKGMTSTFGLNYLKVFKAFETFILSLPLVVRTANNIWMSHSLPDTTHFSTLDYNIFDTEISVPMLKASPSVRALLWDRKHSNELVNELAKALHIETFIVGHQPQPEGFSRPFDKMIILASEHNLGTILPIDLSHKYSTDELFNAIIKIARL